MAVKHILKRNSLLPAIPIVLRDEIGPIDLEGATAVFQMTNVLTGVTKVNAPATVASNPIFTVDASSNTLNSTGHGVSENQDFTTKTTGVMAGGLNTHTRYFARNVTANSLQVAKEENGEPIEIENAGSGTHSLVLGLVTYTWTSGDTNTAGTYMAEIDLSIGGAPQTVPSEEYITVAVITDLANPGDNTERTIAIRAVMDVVSPHVSPVLTQDLIELEVDKAEIATIWQPSTAYAVGHEVVPPVRNGFAYRCISPGTSGASMSQADWPRCMGEIISDGQGDLMLEWRCIGTDQYNSEYAHARTCRFDINLAAQNCWLTKARLSSDVVQADGVAFNQTYEHCIQQAAAFEPFTRTVTLLYV